jgi:hypothetical protein
LRLDPDGAGSQGAEKSQSSDLRFHGRSLSIRISDDRVTTTPILLSAKPRLFAGVVSILVRDASAGSDMSWGAGGLRPAIDARKANTTRPIRLERSAKKAWRSPIGARVWVRSRDWGASGWATSADPACRRAQACEAGSIVVERNSFRLVAVRLNRTKKRNEFRSTTIARTNWRALTKIVPQVDAIEAASSAA